MGRLFGTDGIRGEANHAPMDGVTAFLVGQAVTHLSKNGKATAKIVLGRDTRISGTMLEHALSAGIASMGGDPYLTGILPTPGVAFLCRSMHMDAGIMISASHNPYEDNGIKIFTGAGFKLSDREEGAIEDLIQGGRLAQMAPPAREIGQARSVDNAPQRYIAFLKACFPTDLSMKGVPIVIDTANGATYQSAPALFAELGADVETIHDAPDGTNINQNCGSQFTQDLCRRVKQGRAVMGLAFDGDGDRLIAVDETGKAITGDQIMLICAKALKDMGRLKNDRVVSTVMSNLGFVLACKKYGMKHHASQVGDRYVLQDMQRLGAVIGGEDSGHMIFLDHHTTGDGILAAMQLIAAMLRQGKPLSDLAGMMDVYPQVLINVEVKRKPEISTLPGLVEAIQQAEAELGDDGRVLVRYSGTQNLCRVMVEGPTRDVTETYGQQLADAVKRAIG
ncbi:MAG: phosphoglucosamine mutase [Deltaproteobacteria bacterium]|nr:phosphoglucosamine mutase [Deltaproteobacteria bacterium]